MTAIIDNILVTGTPEEISQLIKIHNSRITIGTGTTPVMPLTPLQPIRPYIVGDTPNQPVVTVC